MISVSSTGCWAVLQLPCCPSKQGELPEKMLQNLLHKLTPQTVETGYFITDFTLYPLTLYPVSTVKIFSNPN